MIALKLNTFYLPKAGNKPEEYEDAFGSMLKEAKRLVVADGASQGFESRKWASSLVSVFKRKVPVFEKEEIEKWLEKPIKEWKGTINWKTLPWYAEEKARRGAFSTLLALDFGNEPFNKWQAMAVGDSCLFQIREDRIIVRFPVESSKDFDSSPYLISTKNDYNSLSLDNLRVCTGDVKPGDRFVLATDAFSAWFLRRVEANKKPWNAFFELAKVDLPDMVKTEIFKDIIAYFRSNGRMQNDDVTVLLAEIEEKENVHKMADEN
jgi:serine/threonine protein phosphatase PrpC